ncbi:hypothetical protein LCGC14_1482590 [marine sediment metagenome]|uniref:Uncharacterized protein n=1 Tax=marine sediment metagenome TaxID=412755 RepID=A0A0F9LPJ5_9ZZZZ
MNSEDKNTNNNKGYKAMLTQSLLQLEERARTAGYTLEVEFDITQGQTGDDETFQEGGTFVATYIPEEEEEEEEEDHAKVNWPSAYFAPNFDVNFDVHLNGMLEEDDFQDYDKMTADIELKEDIVKCLQEEKTKIIYAELDALVDRMDEEILKEVGEKARVIEAFDKAKIDPETF